MHFDSIHFFYFFWFSDYKILTVTYYTYCFACHCYCVLLDCCTVHTHTLATPCKYNLNYNPTSRSRTHILHIHQFNVQWHNVNLFSRHVYNKIQWYNQCEQHRLHIKFCVYSHIEQLCIVRADSNEIQIWFDDTMSAPIRSMSCFHHVYRSTTDERRRKKNRNETLDASAC